MDADSFIEELAVGNLCPHGPSAITDPDVEIELRDNYAWCHSCDGYFEPAISEYTKRFLAGEL